MFLLAWEEISRTFPGPGVDVACNSYYRVSLFYFSVSNEPLDGARCAY